MIKREYHLLFLLLCLVVSTQAGCSEEKLNKYSRDIFAMDTYINCQILSEDQTRAEKGLDRVEQAFLEVDGLTNRFDHKSDVSAVNENAGIAAVEVSQDVIKIVEAAMTWSDKTDGAFNILIGSAMNLWGFGSDRPTVPAEQDLAEALQLTDYHKIVLDAPKSTLFLPEKGMVLDLGGVAKGYATDKAVEALRELGIENALINAGGNVYAMGTRADGTPWKVGVQDPRNPQGTVAVLEVSDTALVSSGDYQRYFEVDGIRYHHILDPATGCPARASVGTTVIMKSAAAADILSTALFVKGPQKGIPLAESFSQVDAAMILTEDGGMSKTRSFNDYLIEQ